MEKMLPLGAEWAKARNRRLSTNWVSLQRPYREEKLKPAREGAKLTKKVWMGKVSGNNMGEKIN